MKKLGTLTGYLVVFGSFILMIFLALQARAGLEWNGLGNLSSIHGNLYEGQYRMTVAYSSVEDVYLETYVISRGQEYVLAGDILPASEAASEYSVPFMMDFTVHNEGLRFRCPYASEGAIRIQSLKLKPLQPLVRECAILLVYLALAFSTLCLLKQEKHKLMLLGVLSLHFTLLFVIFRYSLRFLAVICVLYVLLLCFTKKWIETDIVSFEKLATGLFYYCVALVLLFVFSASSPMYVFNYENDENIYYSVGRGMAAGKKLYTELFDHKGPAFFFLYMVGYLLTPGKFYGAYWIEVLNLCLAMLCIYKIAGYYVKDRLAKLIPFLMFPFIYNATYCFAGGTFEETSIPVLLLLFVVSLPDFLPEERNNPFNNRIDEVSADRRRLRFALQGFLAAYILFSKFNVTFVWLFVSFVYFILLVKKYQKRYVTEFIVCYVAGFCCILLPVIVYFVLMGNLKQFIFYYFIFNGKYASISSLSDTIVHIIKAAYEHIMRNKFSSIVILIGLAGFVFSKTKLNLFGKTALAGSFVILIGTTYAGANYYNYYYLIVSPYAVFGILFAACCLKKQLERLTVNEYSLLFAAFVGFMSVFYFNDTFLKSIPFERQPHPQSIFAQQMRLFAKEGDVSFFEYDSLEKGFVAESGNAPSVQYFFAPNINRQAFSGVEDEQNRYIAQGLTAYVIFQRFREDDYPVEVPMLSENYDFLIRYQYPETGETFMLYQRKW